MGVLTIKLDKLSKRPIFIQIKEQIQQAILDNSLPDHYLLPTEKEFSLFYHVSMGSIKHAYDELEAEGYIVRVKGKGSFALTRPTLKVKLNDLKDSLLLSGFDTPLTEKVLLVEKIKLDESPYPFIEIDLNDEVYLFKTLYYYRNHPAFINEIFVNSKLFPNIDKYFPFKQSFTDISQFFDIRLTKQKCRFLTDLSDDLRCNLLQLQPKQAITQFISVFYNEHGEVCWIEVRHFPSAYTSFERVTKNV